MTSKQKLIGMLTERSRKHDAFRLAETAFTAGRADGYSEEMNTFDIAHGEVLDWMSDTDHLDQLLGFLRADETQPAASNEQCEHRELRKWCDDDGFVRWLCVEPKCYFEIYEPTDETQPVASNLVTHLRGALERIEKHANHQPPCGLTADHLVGYWQGRAEGICLEARVAFKNLPVETKALNAAMTQEMQRAEWRHIHRVLREAQQRIQADGVRHSWMDGAIGIAEARAKGEGLSEEPTATLKHDPKFEGLLTSFGQAMANWSSSSGTREQAIVAREALRAYVYRSVAEPVNPSMSLGKGVDATMATTEPVRRPETLFPEKTRETLGEELARKSIETFETEKTAASHTTEQDFQHWLSYSGIASASEADLRAAFYAGANAEPPESGTPHGEAGDRAGPRVSPVDIPYLRHRMAELAGSLQHILEMQATPERSDKVGSLLSQLIELQKQMVARPENGGGKQT